MKYPFNEDVLRAVAKEVGIELSLAVNYADNWSRGFIIIDGVQYGRIMFKDGFFSHTKIYTVGHRKVADLETLYKKRIMKFRIETEEEQFKPVKVAITCETAEELQELEIRMDLYKSDLETVRRDAARKLPDGNSCMKGICEFRKMLSKALGTKSLKYLLNSR